MNTIGHNIKITFIGESHGPYLGIVIDNLPAGLKIDEDLIKENLSKEDHRQKSALIELKKTSIKLYQVFLMDLLPAPL